MGHNRDNFSKTKRVQCIDSKPAHAKTTTAITTKNSKSSVNVLLNTRGCSPGEVT